mmetsp:Transcript_10982/g.13103  ORF Transcript_10982/g.13103 Transcript_10982/m.13103 type:complete len:431 (-) Transcript_10982:77-1369(-)|eukprot:jgi/Bigna1/88944/estExt_fgenesh1_pg.C_410006
MSTVEAPDGNAEAIGKMLEKLDKLNKQYSLSHKEKIRRMNKLISQICKKVDAMDQKTAAQKAMSACWKGRAYGSLPEHTAEAEEHLTKAIKLEPGLVEAWNCLGTEYWKKKDLKAAGDCFRGAIEQQENKVSLRKLSMVIRNFGEEDTKRSRLAESIKLAKRAIALDVKDGESWYILGNAYMMTFFTTFATSDLEGCLKAYEAAEKSTVDSANKKPDLYYNRANVYKYYENFQEAIDGYKKAIALDPQLPGQDQIDNINRFVTKLAKLVATRNGIKGKKLAKLASVIPENCQIKNSKRVELDELENGENKDTFLVGVTVSPVTRPESVPVSFIVMDKKNNMFVVSIYDVVSSLREYIKIGDVIYVNRPNLSRKSVNEFKERVYPCVTVSNPVNISVNGNALPKEAFAKPSVRVETFSTAVTKEGKLTNSN